MLAINVSTRIYLCVEPCDMRKSFTGLYAVVVNHLGGDPLGGALYLFTNKRRTRLKVLHWDGTGLWVLTKRLEKGTFSWPDGLQIKEGKLDLSPQAMNLLLEGVELKDFHQKAWYER